MYKADPVNAKTLCSSLNVFKKEIHGFTPDAGSSSLACFKRSGGSVRLLLIRHCSISPIEPIWIRKKLIQYFFTFFDKTQR